MKPRRLWKTKSASFSANTNPIAAKYLSCTFAQDNRVILGPLKFDATPYEFAFNGPVSFLIGVFLAAAPLQAGTRMVVAQQPHSFDKSPVKANCTSLNKEQGCYFGPQSNRFYQTINEFMTRVYTYSGKCFFHFSQFCILKVTNNL